ncbi:MAG TPA: 16S rRNA (cytosine(1402)-N(4))-methyltransferase RsmH [Gammaproteobacteria bacterium]|nr:16S rRNA (cytosine(1402)-N(4))-methyltransferase RsmH [Gammaproteobacteria bacterium]
MSTTYPHQAVLLDEVMDALQIRPDGIYVDATFGRGGHAEAILQKLGSKGRLIALDKDPEAVQVAMERQARDRRFVVFKGAFVMLGSLLAEQAVVGKVNGLVLDLGVSSPQLDDPARGFSFLRDGPLDMRMDPAVGLSAAQWLAAACESEIARVLKVYGEERYARRLAKAIVAARAEAPIVTTGRLAGVLAAAHPAWEEGKHPATRAFQAIRIYINGELDELEACLPQAVKVLAPGGRLAVISFHSLEDRMVKRFFREQARGGDFPRGLPVRADAFKPLVRLVGKARRPGGEELARNPRARSAVLRVVEKL